MSENLYRSRAAGMNKDVVSDWFKKIRLVLEEIAFLRPCDMFNMDETGLTTLPEPKKVVVAKGSKVVHTVSSGERGSNTKVIGYCNAQGVFIPPMIIYKGSRLEPQHIAGFPENTLVATSPNGWIDKDLAVRWLKQFIEFRISPVAGSKTVFTLMDTIRMFTTMNFFTWQQSIR